MKLANLIRGNDRGAIPLRVLLSALLIAASSGVGFTAFMQPAQAALAPGSICHANANNKDPYVVNAPDFTAQAGGHGDHTGDIWYHDKPGKWGDIIPSFDYVENGVTKTFPGLNWGVAGQEIWANDCGPVYPDLAIVKTGPATANEGGTGTYTLNVSNVGDGTAFGTVATPITVRDTMPAGVVATAWTGTGWNCTIAALGAGITCLRTTNLSPGAAAAPITVTVTWGSTGVKPNTATVDVVQGEEVVSNNTATIRTTVAGPLLSGTVVKTSDAGGDTVWTDDETTPTAGAPVTFRVTVTNTSGVTVNVGALSDSFGATTITPDCLVAKPTILASGAAFTCEFTVPSYTAPAGGSVTNTFSVPLSRTDSTSVTLTDSAVVRTGPTLSGTVVKTSDADGNGTWTDDETTPVAGAAVTFRATITNTSGVTVTLGALSDNYGAAPGTTITPDCLAAEPATLAAGDFFVCEFTVSPYTAAAGGDVSNTFSATLSRTGSNDVTPTGSAIVRTGDILSGTVLKTSDADGDTVWTDDETTPTAGAPVTFRATVTNTSGVTVTVGALSDTFGATTITPDCLVDEPATLAAGDFFICEFTVPSYTAAAGGSVTNTFSATLSKAGSSSVTPTGSAVVRTGPTLSGTVVKTSDADGNGTWTDDETTPVAGAPVTFRATITNTSGVTVTLGALSDNYGAAPGTTITPDCLAAEPATLDAGDSFVCEFTVPNYSAGAGGDVSNTFSATLSRTGSNDVTPNGSAIVRTSRPDLKLTKTGPATRTTGQTGDYSLLVENVGPAPATAQIRVTDTLPPGVTVVGPISSGGFTCTVAANVVTCLTDADLLAGASATIVLPATFTAVGNQANTATVSVTGDVNPANDTSVFTTSVADPFIPPPPPLPADLAVVKTGPASVSPGDTVTWTVTITNKGPGNASGFSMTDTLPSGVTLSTLTGGSFACTEATVVCTFTSVLLPGASAVVTVVGTVAEDVQGATLTNLVVVGPTDATPADNTDTAVSVIDRPAPSPSPSAEPSPIQSVTSPQPVEGSPTPTPSQEPSPSASVAPSQLPFVEETPEPDAEPPLSLPFTGSSTDALLALGATLSLVGLMVALTGRRRRTAG